MWNNTEPSQQLLAEISKELVAEIAPDESQYVDEMLAEYRANPPQPAAHTDDPLGFGGDVMVMATPAIAMAINAVFTFLLTEVIKSVKDESAELIKQKVQAFFRRGAEKPEVLLSKDQLLMVRKIVKKELGRGGMNPQQAEDAALKIVARLSLAG